MMEKVKNKFDSSQNLGTETGVHRVVGTYYHHLDPLTHVRDIKDPMDDDKPVYLLRWRADSGVTEANVAGMGRLTLRTGDQRQAKGKVVFKDGQYRLVIKRPRATGEPHDPKFPIGRFLSVAFMAWDGGAGEQESQMAFSSWYYLLLEPPPSRTRWIYPPLAAIGVLGLELWGIRWARRRARR